MFELQTIEVPELAELGTRVELREVPYAASRAALVAGGMRGLESVLCVSLWVDDRTFTIAELDALPGRFCGPIARLLPVVTELYRLDDPKSESQASDDDGDASEGNA